jgi:hypothetical protein
MEAPAADSPIQAVRGPRTQVARAYPKREEEDSVPLHGVAGLPAK